MRYTVARMGGEGGRYGGGQVTEGEQDAPGPDGQVQIYSIFVVHQVTMKTLTILN